MSYFTQREVAILEKIEALHTDRAMDIWYKALMLLDLWKQLEQEHGSTLANIITPDNVVIERPIPNE